MAEKGAHNADSGDENEWDANLPSGLSATFAQSGPGIFMQVGHWRADGFNVRSLESEDDLEDYLTRRCDFWTGRREVVERGKADAGPSPEGVFVLLDPTFGWGRLQITRRGMEMMARHFHIFPSFFEYLTVFGERLFAKDEGFGGYKAISRCEEETRATSFQSCFLWKYVEAGDARSRYPYNIRHTLIYQQFEAGKSVNIVIRTSKRLAARMHAALTAEDAGHSPLIHAWPGLQILCVESGLDDWRDFTNYLDHELSKVFEDLVLSGMSPCGQSKADELQQRLSSLKRLQFYSDQILRASHVLEVNATTLDAMLEAFERRRDYITDLPALRERLTDVRQEYLFLQKMASSVVARATMLSYELRDTMSLRNHDINTRAADAAAQGTLAIVNLSLRGAYEARVVKLLSVVAVVFLPASFAAEFLQMGYISVPANERFRIRATTDIWLYAILAIPLLIVTIASYTVFELLGRPRAGRRAAPPRQSEDEIA